MCVCDQLPYSFRPDVPKDLDLVDEVDRASIASMDVKSIMGLNGYRDTLFWFQSGLSSSHRILRFAVEIGGAISIGSLCLYDVYI